MARVVNGYLFLLIVFITSCQEDNPYNRPDVSAIDLDLKIDRFDQKLKHVSREEILTYNTIWQHEYPYFYPDYMFEMLEIGNPKDSILIENVLGQVLQKKDFIDLANAVTKTFPNLTLQEKELTQAFKYIKYYYPDYKVPQIIAFIGGFSFQTPLGEDYIGIGLDMFLGVDSEFYPALIKSIPMYISRRFTPANITPRLIETVLREEILPLSSTTNNTLQHMIYNGKIMYAMDVILPDAKEEDKIGYTKEQWEWAKRYQKDIWAWFIQEKLLYNTDYPRIQKYFSEAPFTPELGENNSSSPKLGTYIGWMIVREYMKRNPQLSLKQLLENNDAQQILEGSKFRG
ncbi:gliding motility lipoprotein GldB [Sphingobacterium rhinopitheci]|uniref:gliding motility lipoprotein GldB n=1 Tax=Sphingobacterium rhinopitheci TaxID=2781960 RepID=UPI001F5178FE|nr:gliding motility lipoprotein GldB [Sphingobacterium rhinopitheci]MCI0920897.1 gliding motility lipoprotein GldB [Sphingobacterium rhinopitheci]